MLDMKEKVIAVMCLGFLNNLFTELTDHACNMFTHLKLNYFFSQCSMYIRCSEIAFGAIFGQKQ